MLGRDDDAARCVQVRERGAAGRRAGHRRADHASGPDQRRLRRRAHRDVGDGHGDDGQRHGAAARAASRTAAEAAVPRPLLEDISLSGAHGILVNVTAGLDLAIGEFEEVGRIVKEFASEDATVVVGTVIDPDMSNELRVTVVATGLGSRRMVTRAAHREPSR